MEKAYEQPIGLDSAYIDVINSKVIEIPNPHCTNIPLWPLRAAEKDGNFKSKELIHA